MLLRQSRNSASTIEISSMTRQRTVRQKSADVLPRMLPKASVVPCGTPGPGLGVMERGEVTNRTPSALGPRPCGQRRRGPASAKTAPSVFDMRLRLLCSVCPSAIRAATPVGAVTRTPLTPCCSLRAQMILRSVKDLPVPG